MKTARIARAPSTSQGTFGVLTFGANTMRSLELPWRDNQRGRSCIPTGTYECRRVRSMRLGYVYGLMDVPGRSGILIHPANFAGDVDLAWQSQLEGCIAPCTKLGLMRNKNGVMQTAGLVSRPAVNALVSWAGGLPFILEVS